MCAAFRYVGKDYPIHNAEQKVRGEMSYTADHIPPNALHIKLILSNVAHAMVRNIDISKAMEVDGVVKIYSHLNTPKTVYNTYRTVPGQSFCVDDQRIFTEKARYYGDRIAAVVATTEEAAIHAATLVQIEYEPLPVSVRAENSLSNDAYPIHPNGNLLACCETEYGEVVAEQAGEVLVKSRTHTQAMHHAAMEPHAYIASFDGDTLIIRSPTQGVYGCRTVVADYLKMDYSKVRIIKEPMGGSFGGKQEFILEPVIGYIAKDLRRTVALCMNRKESVIGTIVRPAHDMCLESRFSPDGRILDCHVEDILNAGAYWGNSVSQINAISTKAERLYRYPHYTHKGMAVYTNTIPAGGMRGWGSPELYTALEIHMDDAAGILGIDPAELRLKNLVHPDDVTPAEKISLGNCRVIDCLTIGMERFDWSKRRAAVKAEPIGRWRRGVGMACGVHKNNLFGMGFPDLSTVTIKMNTDGSIDLIGSFHEMGCGTLRSMQIIVAEELNLPLNRIRVSEGDTAVTPYDEGTYASRITYVLGRCVQLAAQALLEDLKKFAAKRLNCSAQQIETRGNGLGVIGNECSFIDYRKLATSVLFEEKEELIVTKKFQADSNPNASSVQFAQVAVDTLTGLIRVEDFLVVQDVGQAINRQMVEGQIQGGVELGIGYALCEDVGYNINNGKVSNETFKNYHIINFFEMPRIDIVLVEDGNTSGPYGAKGVGEMATVPTAAAVANAVSHALGLRMCELPLTPEKVLQAISTSREVPSSDN